LGIFKKTPIRLGLHQCLPFGAVGSHSQVLIVFLCNEDFSSMIQSDLIQIPNFVGFQTHYFNGENFYSAGRNDGTIAISQFVQNTWILKSTYCLPN
jgi:hypothetical protein